MAIAREGRRFFINLNLFAILFFIAFNLHIFVRLA
jgi:flagellar biogenesis protein FliO